MKKATRRPALADLEGGAVLEGTGAVEGLPGTNAEPYPEVVRPPAVPPGLLKAALFFDGHPYQRIVVGSLLLAPRFLRIAERGHRPGLERGGPRTHEQQVRAIVAARTCRHAIGS